MLQFMQYNINHCDASKGETYRLAKEFGQKLIDNTREVVGKPPVYKDGAFPQCIVPHMFITDLFLLV
jgi:fatty acid synthase subunit beta